MSWGSKYAPRSVADLYDREKDAKRLCEVFRGEPHATVIVVGPVGVGRTALVDVVLAQELGFTVMKYDSITYKNDKILEHLYNLNTNNLLDRLRGRGPLPTKRTALVVDNLDTISLSSERSIIDKMVSRNIESKLFPMVLIVSDQSQKLVDEIKGATCVIRLDSLSDAAMLRIMDTILKAEDVQGLDAGMKASILASAQGDIRCLINVLQDLSMCFSGRVRDAEAFALFMENLQTKSIDRHLFDAYCQMLLRHGSIKETEVLYNNDKVLLPLILQENYCKDIFNRRNHGAADDALSRLRTASFVTEHVSQGDIIETFIYTDQNWHFQEMHCFTSCTLPIARLDQDCKYRGVGDIGYRPTFSSELNKTSLKNINRKNISLMCSASGITSGDIHMVSSLLNELAKSESYDAIGELVSHRTEDPLKFVEAVIKVDKCNASSIPFNNRTRKTLGAHMKK